MTCEQVNALGSQLFLQAAPSDDMLATAYLLFKNEGLLEAVYHDRVPSLREFLDRNRETNTQTTRACFARPLTAGGEPDSSQCHLAGMGWCWDIRRYPGGNASGEAGMAFLRRYQRGGYPREFTAMMLEECFGPLHLDVVYGTSMAPNRACRIFALDLGFTFGPTVPMAGSWQGRPCAVEHSWLTREAWERHLQKSTVAPEDFRR